MVHTITQVENIDEIKAGFERHVAVLSKDGEVIKEELSGSSAHCIHMLLGMLGEFGEFQLAHMLNDQENMLEELGDFEFYYSGLIQGLKKFNPEFLRLKRETSEMFHKASEYDPLFVDNYIRGGFGHLCHMIDLLKKVFIYNKNFDILEIEREFISLNRVLNSMYYIHHLINGDFTYDQVVTMNIEKLKVRYPEGYSDKNAQIRLDKESVETQQEFDFEGGHF